LEIGDRRLENYFYFILFFPEKMKSNYQKLTVWQKAMDLAEVIYTITKKFPASELYGLVSQMRRCSVSIPSNIAE